MKNKQKAKFSFGAYLSFFTRFPIPWWLFLLSLLLGFANTEVVLAVSNYLIRINKGELYNGVIIGYALMNVFNALLSMLINLTGGYGSALVTLRARKLLWRKILHLPMREVERRQPSALISGLVNDITQASLVVQMAFNTIVSLYSFFRCCWEMYRFDGTLSLYMLLLLPIAVLVFALVGHLQYQMMLRRYDSLNVMTTFFSEHISAAKHVKAQAMEDLEVTEGLKAIDSRYKADLYYAFMVAVQTLSNSLYNTIGTIVIALCGSDLIRQGKMPETGINDFSTYKGRVDQYTAEVLTHYQTLKGTQGALQYVGVLLDGPEEDPQAGNPLPDKQTAQDIRLERVSFGYIPQQPVLHDLSFTIPPWQGDGHHRQQRLGQIHPAQTPPGHLCAGQRPYLAGQHAGGRVEALRTAAAVRVYPAKITRSSPGRSVTTSPYGETGPADQRRVEQAARLADADSFIRQLPNGYDTDVGRGGGRCCPAASGSASPLRGPCTSAPPIC